MKKIILFVACAMIAVVTNAAAVGWSLGGLTGYGETAYQFFVIGQNGVADISTVTALLDAGKSTSSLAFGSGVAGTTTANVGTSASGKTLDAGTYTAFFVLFDSDSPAAGDSKYAVISGASTLTKTIAATTANVTFAGGSAASILSDSKNWKSFGSSTPTDPTPEPTSGLLLLVGAGMLALRRKQK